jgi:NADH-quinone oxidoreductase subunit M
MLTGLLIVFPFLISLILFGLKELRTSKVVAVAGAIIEFIVSLYALFIYQTECHCQLLLEFNWLSGLGITLRLGLDGLSLILVLLTTFLTPLIILSSVIHNCNRPSSFYGLILFMEMAVIGVLASLNGMLFYIFWELALIPAYFITRLWSGSDRIRFTTGFFIYSFTGSLVLLGAMIYLFFKTPLPHSFDIRFLYGASLTPVEQSCIFIAFFLAFAVMIPVFPFHSWQLRTRASAPPGVTMALAGIIGNIGMYGMIRFLLPVCPWVMHHWGFVVMFLAITGMIYACITALRQDEMKRFTAWASNAQAGLITAGILSVTLKGMEGAVIQIISQGITITGLFILADRIETHSGSRKINELRGMAKAAPWLAALLLIIMLAPFVITFFRIGLFPGFFVDLVTPALKDILQFAR